MTIPIHSLPILTGINTQSDDTVPVLDKHDLTSAPTGTTKQVSLSNMLTPLIPSGRISSSFAQYVTDNAVFNVLDYGAKVDGITNDTVAFTAAITAAASVGGMVRLAVGTMVADPPLIPSNIKIIGQGMGVSIVQANSTAGTFLIQNASYVTLQDFSFIGASNSGVSTTSDGLQIFASTVDSIGCVIRRVAVSQIKADAAIRFRGNGALGTPATFWARKVIVEQCIIQNYYDPDPTNLGVASYGIYGGFGSSDCVVQNNWVDGSYGKHGIGNQADSVRGAVLDNTILNCGLNAPSTYFGYGIIHYSDTSTPVTDARILGNQITYTNRAGIYIQGVNNYVVSGNILENCDQHSAGFASIGTGAISLNNSLNASYEGSGSIVNNTILNPGFCAIYLNIFNFDLADCTVAGNSCSVTTAVNLYGVVLAGRGATISGNVFRGFGTDLYVLNTADNFAGDFDFVGNRCNATGASGTIQHVVYSSVFLLRPATISGNTFQGGATGIVLSTCEALTIANNTFDGLSGTNIVVTANYATITGNISTGGSTGMALTCTASTATARMMVTGNTFSACSVVYTVTPNTGRIILSGNDFGVLDGITTNNNNSPTLTITMDRVQWWNTTLTANRTATLSGTRAYKGARVRILRNAGTPGAFTLAVVDGVSTNTIYTFASATNGWADCEFDGTNWQFIGSGPVT